MRNSHAAGWASDPPTPAQFKEFFAQVESKKITKKGLQRFLASDKCSTDKPADELFAENILGQGKVFGCLDIYPLWQALLPDSEPCVPYSEDALRQSAASNNAEIADWRLVYLTGRDLRTQRSIRGIDRDQQPCFDPIVTRWLEAEHMRWSRASVPSGYRLLDFSRRYQTKTWPEQEEYIASLSPRYERAQEQAVAEACLSIYILNNGERLLSDWWHWGRMSASDGGHAAVGSFDSGGFSVISHSDDRPLDKLGVVISRKPDKI